MSHLARGPMRSMGINSTANGAGRRPGMPFDRTTAVGGGDKGGGGARQQRSMEVSHAH
jgi:hypothetical protein